MPGQAVKGKAVFQAKCASCHKVLKEGTDIGPELTLIGKKFDKSGLLDAIVNPSAGMAFGYESWLITRKDGTTASGFLQAEGSTGCCTRSRPLISIPASSSPPALCPSPAPWA
jgi:putative heme-binding domain-containing protein